MRSIFSYWHFDWRISIFIVLLCTVFLYSTSFKFSKRFVFFFFSVLTLIAATMSPLHFLGEHYLFSLHMIVHVLILLVAPPLFVLAIPTENKFKKNLLPFSKLVSKTPIIAWILGIGIMWFWHIPVIFNQLFEMPGMDHSSMDSMNTLSYLHLLSLFAAGIIFCWPVINPYSQYRLFELTSVIYLSTACMACSLLGLLITFAPLQIYQYYALNNDQYGFLSLIRNQWNISPLIDQQIGGLIMWVPCCFIYLSAAMYLLKKWFSEKRDVQFHH